jgi:hypothetical protein
MGARPRIRWPKVARLTLGAIACAALLAVLPGLIRRPKPPPLQPDIGLPPAAAAEGALASRRRAGARPHTRPAPERTRRRKLEPPARAPHRERHGRTEVADPAPAPTSTVTRPSPVPQPSPPVPPASPPAIPPPASSPPPESAPAPDHPSEFGFER